MQRLAFLAVAIGLAVGGCSKPTPMMEPLQKPAPAPEMAKLARLIGTWSGTAEMVTPSPEEMNEGMPEGEEMPTSFKGEDTYEWVLGGMFLRSEGWREMGPDERAHMIEYWAWDAKANKFRTWYASDWGEYGSGWATLDDDGNTLHFKGRAHDAHGNVRKGEGKMTFVDDRTVEWCWKERGPSGKMAFKGTSRKR